MVIHFYIKFKTEFGQSVSIIIDQSDLALSEPLLEVPLNYLNTEYWYGNIDTNRLLKIETLH